MCDVTMIYPHDNTTLAVYVSVKSQISSSESKAVVLMLLAVVLMLLLLKLAGRAPASHLHIFKLDGGE